MGFEHYLYVLRCEDGSYYTGYTTRVEERFAAHASGRGARYTRAHPPASLAACARFYTKRRAMSAEYHFKQLDRAQKERLLAAYDGDPIAFAAVLARELPGFATAAERPGCEGPAEPVGEWVARCLCENVDEGYRAFNVRLIPSVPAQRVAGVRTPALRSLAKQLARRADANDFLGDLPHTLFEENQLHAFAIATLRDDDELLAAYEAFLPYIDNWATCDQLATKPLMRQPDRALRKALEWMGSGVPYTMRFGMRVLMGHFLRERFEPRFLELVARVPAPCAAGEDLRRPPAPGYYVNMMRAWFFAEALAHQEAAALPWLEGRAEAGALDEWTRRKAVQKARESRKVPAELKARLTRLPGQNG